MHGMASDATLPEHMPDTSSEGAALQHGTWRRQGLLSRALAGIERFLVFSGFDRAPWLVVAFGTGIAAWFGLDNGWQWLGLAGLCSAITIGGVLMFAADGEFPYLRQAIIAVPILLAAGCLTVWAKSAAVGSEPIAKPSVSWLNAMILDRAERPAEARVRLWLATREAKTGRVMQVRVNLPEELDHPDLSPGALVRIRARLMPPAPPMLPGAYDFSRKAWFSGLAATGSVLEQPEILSTGDPSGKFAIWQDQLSRHVRDNLSGSPGGIAAALASGDRGGIAEEDAQAMRDAGLAHLLAISGLHVSAVIGAAYLLAIRLLALWPWLALRVRLPLFAAATGAFAGVGYTLLTGAQVPTMRSCIGALLVLIALALGREALSLRMLAVAAFIVLLLWPESIVGPSFQMSFAAVTVIIALNSSDTVRRFLAPREEGWGIRAMRYGGMLLLTGFAIELALMPIGLYHFHRAGVYGALANVIAIPLTTMLAMPLIALALIMDGAGAGAPAWWLAGKVIDGLLGLAHFVSSRPGAVTLLPAMGIGSFALFLAGGLWLGLWQRRIRMLGLIPAIVGVIGLTLLRPPDILISSDGRHVGITGEADGKLVVLRDSSSSYVRDNLTELAGMRGDMKLLTDWSGANCNRDFCTAKLHRGGRDWHILLARSRDMVPERQLAAACDRADIVIADRWLPRSCQPRWLKADRQMLSSRGGLAINLAEHSVESVADGQGDHGWWDRDK